MSGKTSLRSDFTSMTPSSTIVRDFESQDLISGNPKVELKSNVTLCMARTFIVQSRLSEPEANAWLRSSDLPEIASYLLLTNQINVDVELVPEYDLGELLKYMIHSEVSGKSITEVIPVISADRPNSLDDYNFEKFLNLLCKKIFPLIKEYNCQTIVASIQDVVAAYPSFETQTRMLLEAMILEASAAGQFRYLQGVYNKSNDYMERGKRNITNLETNHSVETNNEIQKNVQDFLTDLNSNTHVAHPTKYERLLRLFISNNLEPVDMDKLSTEIYGDTDDPDRALHFKISQLNAKLRTYGLEIDRTSQYMLRKVGTKKQS